MYGALAKMFLGSFAPFTAKCVALWEGLRFVAELGLVVHEVECDAIDVVWAVHS